MLHFLRLAGTSVTTSTAPTSCAVCGCKDLYQQADFKRSVGVGLMILVTIICTVLFALNVNWFLVWTPMVVLLIVDMILRKITPLAAICYSCGAVHRGAPTEELSRLPSFDLETYDRIQYKKIEQT